MFVAKDCIKMFCYNSFFDSKSFIHRTDDGKAYTEDGVLIYNIFLYKIHQSITKNDIVAHFSKFGKIVKSELRAEKQPGRGKSLQIGFINFDKPQSALKALLRKPHQIKGHSFSIKASDSWQQPNAFTYGYVNQMKPYSRNAAITAEKDDGKSFAGILALNDDCLRLIFDELTLKDCVSFSRVCQRFRNIFREKGKVMFKEFNTNVLVHLTLWEVRDILQHCGVYVKRCIYKFCAINNVERIFDFIGKYCPNLEYFKYDMFRILNGDLHKFVHNKKSLNKLVLKDCDLNNGSIAVLHKLPNLRSLDISINSGLSGKYLDKFKNLQELILHNCPNIQPWHFKMMFQKLTELKVLNIKGCFVKAEHFMALSQNLLKLESLAIDCHIDENYECIGNLPELKRLDLNCISLRMRNELFEILPVNNKIEELKLSGVQEINATNIACLVKLTNLKNLKFIRIHNLYNEHLQELSTLPKLEEFKLARVPLVTDNGLLTMIRNCKTLNKITIFECKSIVGDVFQKTEKFLKSLKGVARAKPINFIICYALHKHTFNIVDLDKNFVQVKVEYLLKNPDSFLGNDDFDDEQALDLEELRLDDNNAGDNNAGDNNAGDIAGDIAGDPRFDVEILAMQFY